MAKIFKPYTSKEIEARGWLLDQLKIQAKGLSGNLDKMWPDVRDSQWIGGDREGWERVPYWLDGFIPLAYLLKDEDMIARAKKYIDAIIEGQDEDGWICPCKKEDRAHYDMWALYLILKVLIVYYDCSGDDRIEEVVYKALKNYMYHMAHNTPNNWAAARWYECVISIAWMYERRPEPWLIDLARNLETQGFDYTKALDFLSQKTYFWNYVNHVVNLAMSLKQNSVMSLIDGRNPDKITEKFLAYLCKYHGNVNGYFNGDECLSTTSPIQGTELCGVAEAMYSYEVITQTSRSTAWMDRCERLAFNAFPATVSEDMWTHQYDQMTNQPYCMDGGKKSHFLTNGPQSHMFGLEPHYGCCTANHNQAFPKFTLSCFYEAEDGIAVTSLAPAALTTTVSGVSVKVENDSLYPFRDKASLKITAEKPVSFKLYVRIPGFYDSATVNGEAVPCGQYFVIDKTWQADTVEIILSATPKFVKRGTLHAVVRGALTYSLPVKEKWIMHEYERHGVVRKFPYCDYELMAESEWQYGFSSTELTYIEKDEYKSAFATGAPLCAIKAKVKPIKWGMLKGFKYVPAKYPASRTPVGDEVEIELIPYGCAKLRMTELPILK